MQLTVSSSSQPWKASCGTVWTFLLMGWDEMGERTTKAWGPAPALGVHSALKETDF